MQLTRPVALEKLPAGQVPQAKEPGVAEAVPAGHGVGSAGPLSGHMLPAGQMPMAATLLPVQTSTSPLLDMVTSEPADAREPTPHEPLSIEG